MFTHCTVNRICYGLWSRGWAGGEWERLANDYSKATQRVNRWQYAQESFNDLYPNKLLFRILLSEVQLFCNRFVRVPPRAVPRAPQLYYSYKTTGPVRLSGETTSYGQHTLTSKAPVGRVCAFVCDPNDISAFENKFPSKPLHALCPRQNDFGSFTRPRPVRDCRPVGSPVTFHLPASPAIFVCIQLPGRYRATKPMFGPRVYSSSSQFSFATEP